MIIIIMIIIFMIITFLSVLSFVVVGKVNIMVADCLVPIRRQGICNHGDDVSSIQACPA